MDEDILLQLVTDAGILSVQEQTVTQDISPDMAHPIAFSSNINEGVSLNPENLMETIPREKQSINVCELDELKSAECK